MVCPVCGGKTIIISSRDYDIHEKYRRRKCIECGARFSTAEKRIGEIISDEDVKTLPKGGYYCFKKKSDVSIQ